MACEKEIAINFVVAHSYEARPIIDYYQLSKDSQHHGFSLFRNKQIRLIISGQGKVNAAAATAYLGSLQAYSKASCLWVNIGTAGHCSHDIASLWRINKITDQQSGRSIYPVLLVNQKRYQKGDVPERSQKAIKAESLMSVDLPASGYSQRCLYDMEAFGFFQMATRFESLESIVSFKVVSDNLENPIAALDKTSVANLILPHVTYIDQYLCVLNDIVNINKNSQDIEIKDIKLTHSQNKIVNELIDSLTIHGVNYHSAVTKCSTAKQLIAALTARLKSVQLLL